MLSVEEINDVIYAMVTMIKQRGTAVWSKDLRLLAFHWK